MNKRKQKRNKQKRKKEKAVMQHITAESEPY